MRPISRERENVHRFYHLFLRPALPMQRQYEALRAFYVDRVPAREVARRFGYTTNGFHSLRRDFAKDRSMRKFFIVRARRPPNRRPGKMARLRERVVELRKNFWSVFDIQEQLRREGYGLSSSSVFRILRAAGFGRLPRRLEEERRHFGPARERGRQGRAGLEAPPR
jgi:IS30 family transposase